MVNRNRRNRGRGKYLERAVAKFMGWTRVPMSGSLAQFPGDVVDGTLGLSDGLFCVECKSQQYGTMGSISVTDKTLRQTESQALKCDRFPIMAFTHQGKAFTYIIIPGDPTWDFLFRNRSRNWDLEWKTKVRGKGRGFSIRGRWIELAHQLLGRNWITQVTLNNDDIYYLTTIEEFHRLVNDNGYHRPSQE